MKKEMGASVGLATLLMILLHPVLPERSGTGASDASSQNLEKKIKPAGKRGAEHQPNQATEGKAQPEPVDGPWLTIRSHFHAESRPFSTNKLQGEQQKTQGCEDTASRLGKRVLGRTGQDKLRACLQELSGLPDDFEQNFSSQSIVALVTDPLHTRMALSLDGQIEAIEAAAERGGWQFTGQWLPWGDRIVLPEDDVLNRRYQRRLMREQQGIPGILLFSRKDQTNCAGQSRTDANGIAKPGETAVRVGVAGAEGLARRCAKEQILTIFLVAETPTTGVSGESFFAAMNLATAMNNGNHQIGMLGPNYSGSLPSLGDLVLAWKRDHADAWTASISPIVHSGSVSIRSAAQDFIRQTNLGFQSGIADSPVYAATMLRVLKKYGVEENRVALLVEGGTVFGSDAARATKKGGGQAIRTYVFPRNISQLRNAYREQPGADGRKTDPAAAPALSFSLHDSDEGEDTIPSFSKQTPLMQDAILAAIMRDLQRREIRLVDIAATNSLDILFLCRVLKSQCPDARILIQNAEILFIPDARQDPLRGTLFLSTYPMFAQGEDWLQSNDTVRLFPGPVYQGIYNALVFLLQDLGALPEKNGRPGIAEPRGWGTLQDKAGHSAVPSIWLLSLARSGFTPIDVFQSTDPCSLLRVQTPTAIALKCGSPNARKPIVDEEWVGKTRLPTMPLPSESWLLTTLVLTMASLAYCWSVFIANRPVAPRWLFGFTMGTAGGAPELPILSAGAALSSMLCFLLIPFWLPWQEIPPVWLGGVVIAASFAAVIPYVAFAYARIVSRPSPSGVSWWEYALVAVPYASLLIPWAYCCVQGGALSAAARMFVYRAFELSGGVSPAVPMLATCFAMGAASVMRARRYAALEGMRESLESLPVVLQTKTERLAEMLMPTPRLAGLNLGSRLIPSAAAFAVLLIVNRDGALDPFDQTGFVWAIRIAAFSLLWMVFHYCHDLISRWSAFKDLLIATRSALLDSELEQFSVKNFPKRSFFVQAAWQIHNIVPTLVLCFVALAVLFSTYSPQSPNVVGRWLVVLFLGLGTVVTAVLVGLERDCVLSKVYGSKPGELNTEFWLRLALYAALPLVGLVSHLFPDLSGFVSNWVQPSMEALR
jgi:hypothetical protein